MTWIDDLEDLVEYALRFPLRDTQGLLLGSGLLFLAGLTIPASLITIFLELHQALLGLLIGLHAFSMLFIVGYFVSALRVTALGNDETLSLGLGVLKEGVVFTVALIPWLVAVSITALVSGFLMFLLGGYFGLLVAASLYIAVSLIFIYILPAIAMKFCVEGWRGMYDLGGIWGLAVHRLYILVSLVYHAVFMGISFVFFLSIFTVIGWAFLWFYVLVGSAAFWGRTYFKIEYS